MKSSLTLIFIFNIIYSFNSFAATYYSKATGAANSTATWGINTDGTGTTPGNFTSFGDMFILRSVSTLTSSSTWTIGSGVTLNVFGTFNVNGMSHVITINGTLVLSGTINIAGNKSDLIINGSITFTNTSANQITLAGTSSGNEFVLAASASLITNNVNGVSGTNCSLPLTGMKKVVTLNSAANYTFNNASTAQSTLGLPATVNNLTINNGSATGVILSAASVIVNGVLTLTDGLLIGGTVNITSTTPANVTAYSIASYVTGTLNRNISASGFYDFPVGTLAQFEIATIETNFITGTTAIAVYFSAVDPGTPVGVTFDGTPINDFLNYGRWVITPNIAIASGNFDLTLIERGHTNAAPFLDFHGILRSNTLAPLWLQPGTNVLPAHTALMPSDPVRVSISGITTFSSNNFAIGFSNTYILPIVLTAFEVINTGTSNLLTWTTATELNNDYFSIDRSNDARTFESIGIVSGAGNSSALLHYQFTDEAPLSGINYYRLKQVDFNGDISNSIIRSVLNTSTIAINIYPNPATDFITIQFVGQEQTNVSIALLDQTGRQIQLHYIGDIAENQLVQLPVSDLPAGVYFIKLMQNNAPDIYRFIKQ